MGIVTREEWVAAIPGNSGRGYIGNMAGHYREEHVFHTQSAAVEFLALHVPWWSNRHLIKRVTHIEIPTMSHPSVDDL